MRLAFLLVVLVCMARGDRSNAQSYYDARTSEVAFLDTTMQKLEDYLGELSQYSGTGSGGLAETAVTAVSQRDINLLKMLMNVFSYSYGVSGLLLDSCNCYSCAYLMTFELGFARDNLEKVAKALSVDITLSSSPAIVSTLRDALNATKDALRRINELSAMKEYDDLKQVLIDTVHD